MLSPGHSDRIHVAFDHQVLVANAGLLLLVSLALQPSGRSVRATQAMPVKVRWPPPRTSACSAASHRPSGPVTPVRWLRPVD